ncbi:MAG TPA: beta-glucosidase [Treponemataceae bacterium]|nr:beta-glucosidase [Treponemataceae bacterium]
MNKKIDDIVSSMPLKDKISLCSGKNFWQTKEFRKYGIPSFFISDGPHGLRKQEVLAGVDMLGLNDSLPATCFPSQVTTGASWDEILLQKIGSAIGKEARSSAVALVLGPGVNIKRNPLCGRNFEYFSEDPYASGKMAASFINGLEGQGTGSSLKHFACNSQEHNRFMSDSIIDERTLREIYLSAFEIAVKEGRPSSVMCAYPKINGVHCSDNKELLTEILRKDWGFEGFVITDWSAMNDRLMGFEAGCDLSMPGGSDYMEKDVLAAVSSGLLREEKINESVKRILRFIFKADTTLQEKTDNCLEEHHNIAVEAAVKGSVLLKNEDDVLPGDLSKEKIAIVGYFAKEMRYQGAGSSHINPSKLSQPIDYFGDCDYAQGYLEDGSTTDTLLDEVIEVSSRSDKVVIFAGVPASYESEGFDRGTMSMSEGHVKVIEAAVRVNRKVIVVLLCGSVVECPWVNSVKAILYMGLPGQGGGEAAYNLLTGIANPSGKLTETWPVTYEDVPSSEIYGKGKDALYMEGLYTGYRYYDKAHIKVRWPFGFGLSYTQFEYTNLKADARKVSVDITNIGDRVGEEAVLLYIGKKQEGIHRPVRELKRFCKLALNSGETKTASFELDDRCFAVWNKGWIIEEGCYTVAAGNLCAELYVAGGKINQLQNDWYKSCEGKPDYESFEKVLGRPYVEPVLKKGFFTMDNSIEEMKDYSLIMKIMYKAIEKTIAKGCGGKADYSNPQFIMLMNSSCGGPLRGLQISGGIKGKLFEGLLDMANGHFLRGLLKLARK